MRDSFVSHAVPQIRTQRTKPEDFIFARTEQLLRKVHQRYPDYLFGLTFMASRAIAEGQPEKAERYLNSVGRRQLMHSTEFAAFAMASTQLAALKCDSRTARQWLALFRSLDPEHPQLRQLKRTISFASLWNGVRSIFGWR
jgi:hypothetical protein